VRRAIELRKTRNQDADSFPMEGGTTAVFAIDASSRSCVVGEPAHVKKQQAREPGDLWSASARKGTSRSAKAQSRNADAHAREESDRAIVSMNLTNKEERSSAEPGEKRARAEENIVQSDTGPTQSGETSVPR
jgi:hypothetical protein